MPVTTTYICSSCDRAVTIGSDEGLKDTWFTKADCVLCPGCYKRLLERVDTQVRKLIETDAKLFPRVAGKPSYRGAAWLYKEFATEICKPRNSLYPDGVPLEDPE